jgi:hypothetical protein
MLALTNQLPDINLPAVPRRNLHHAAGRAVSGTAAAELERTFGAAHKDFAAAKVVAIVAGVARNAAVLAPATELKWSR